PRRLPARSVSPPEPAAGVALLGFVPCPSSPLRLYPQRCAVPLGVTPQALMTPALTAANVSPPETATGVVLLVVVPFPSTPQPLSPQQYAAPLGVTPQV